MYFMRLEERGGGEGDCQGRDYGSQKEEKRKEEKRKEEKGRRWKRKEGREGRKRGGGGWERGLSGEVSRREECGDGGVKGIRDGIYGIGV